MLNTFFETILNHLCLYRLLLNVRANKASLVAEGSGGVEDLFLNLSEADVYFGVIRVAVRDKVKFFSVFFVGSEVGGLARGKASLYKDAIFSNFETHGELVFQDGLPGLSLEAFCDAVKKTLRISDLTIGDISYI